MARDPEELRARRREAMIRRRRTTAALVIVGLIAIAVVAFALLSGGSDDPDPVVEEPLPSLTPTQLAGQRLIAGFDGTRIPAGLERMIADGGLAGVILFAENVQSREKTSKMLSELQSIKRPTGLQTPLAVMVDQEGGQVRRVPGPPTASAEEMGRRGTAFAAGQARATAASLLSYGINVNLAPVLDVARRGSAIAAEGRSFGSDPATVVEVGVDGFAASQGEGGVASTAKHFPGLGRARTNTDLEAQRIGSSRADLQSIDEAPFAAFSDSGGEIIMLGLATYPSFSNRPAALSRAVATRELRGRLGFEGVSITDSLDAAAARAFGDRNQVALSAAAAGSDLLLYGDWRTAREINRTLSARLEAGGLDRASFEDSVRRVLALREGLTLPSTG
jgi:beta-N-acetylhexosaminidase